MKIRKNIQLMKSWNNELCDLLQLQNSGKNTERIISIIYGLKQ